MSLNSALRIATTGMQVSQLGLGTVSHNITNANNPNFSRQQVVSSAVAYNGFGAGVRLEDLTRITNKFVELRTLGAQSELAYTEARESYLATIEGTLTNASASGGLDTLLRNVYESFNTLAGNPGDAALKRNVIQQATLLTDTIRSMNAGLDDIQARIDREISADITTLNTSLKRINQLNGEIAAQAGGVSGANANDLLDSRAQELEFLARQYKLSISQISDTGGFRVSTENGRRLVDESGFVQFTRTPGTPFEGIGYQAVRVDGTLSPTIQDVGVGTLTQGKVKGLIDLRDTTIPNLLAQLDNLAVGIRTQINTLHSQGSPFPPQNSQSSAGTTVLAGVGSDLYTGLSASLAGSSLHISVVDSTGAPIATTAGNSLILPAVAPTPIALPGAGPFSLTDLATLINGNALVGASLTATAATNASGQPIFTIAANNPTHRIVLKNVNGDVLGTLGMNNFFTGTDSDDISIRPELISNPSLLSVGQMRATDGGLSSLDNTTAVALSKAGDARLAFGAAGDLGPITATTTGYLNQLTSNLSVQLADAKSRADFAQTLNTQLQELKSGISGVNLNEELALMLVYQNSFQASARIINVVNDLFETLINTVR